MESSFIKEVFASALGVPAEKLAEFLADRCNGDAALQAEITSLLQAHRNAGRFLEPGGDSIAAQADDPEDEAKLKRFEWLLLDEQPGNIIDRYKLLEVLGEGGHGIVFRAEQEQPVRRTVALKVIRKGMETPSARARFDIERQTMASMDHPNIAKLFDAGTTEQGRPYFVMELVFGSPVTSFCDEHRLPIRRRVELFITICRAVHHAHQKGVIHRDLKPTNILVAESDGISSAKVIDFGIAQAMSPTLDATQDLQMIGTPIYMSPEQVSTEKLAIDIRSDVYSLGAILCELLVGVTPFGWNDRDVRTIQELRNIFADEPPISPSELLAKVTGLPSGLSILETISQNRHVAAPALRKSLREDLDSIVLKSIHRDRALRYDSVAALADDLQRYLERRPVLAAPATVSYLCRRFAVRNKTAVLFSLLAAFLLVVSMCAITIGLFLTRSARDRALAAERSKGISEANAVSKLRESYSQQAKAGARSRWPGQRLQSLQAITQAARIAPSMPLRNEAIACMSLPDVELVETWPKPQPRTFMRFSDKMDCYAVSDPQGSVRIIRMSDRAQVALLPGTGKPLYDILRFSPDEKYVVTWDASGLQFWNIATQKIVLGHSSTAFAFTNDARSLAVSTPSGAVDFYSLPQVKKIRSIAGVGSAKEFRFAPDQDTLAVWSDDAGLRMVPIRPPGEIRRIATDVSPILGLAWHPEGHEIALAGFEPLGRIEILNADTGKLQAAMSGHVATPIEVAFTRDGRFLLSIGWDSRAMIWDAATGAEMLSIEDCTGALQLAPDDSQFSVAGAMNHQMWRFTAGSEFRSLKGSIEDNGVLSSDFNPDGSLFAVATHRGVRVWSLQTGRQFCFLSLPGPRSVLFSPDGQRLYTSAANGAAQWTVAELAGRQDPITDEVTAGATSALAASSDFRTMVFGAPDGSLRVANPNKLDDSLPLAQHIRASRHLAVSSDGAWAVSSSRFEKPKVWDLIHRKLVRELPISPNIPEAGEAAFDPSGKILITSDNLAYRWYSVGDWKMIHQFDRSPGNAGLVAFSPDGKLVALAGHGFSILLADAATGEELATLDTPIPHGPGAICFSRDSRLLAVAGAGDSVMLWDLPRVRLALASMNLNWH